MRFPAAERPDLDPPPSTEGEPAPSSSLPWRRQLAWLAERYPSRAALARALMTAPSTVTDWLDKGVQPRTGAQIAIGQLVGVWQQGPHGSALPPLDPPLPKGRLFAADDAEAPPLPPAPVLKGALPALDAPPPGPAGLGDATHTRLGRLFERRNELDRRLMSTSAEALILTRQALVLVKRSQTTLEAAGHAARAIEHIDALIDAW